MNSFPSTVSPDDVIERCAQDGPVDLVKMDTKGGEAEIQEGARLQTLKTVKQLVLEYYDALCECALARCERALGSADFHRITGPIGPKFGVLYALSAVAERFHGMYNKVMSVHGRVMNWCSIGPF